ncbi:hypothetical protein FACS1894202_08310 [Clostridia bacterium]|nr:hypothetical protein FACS1894202_08310 [Clostridia bacterium]
MERKIDHEKTLNTRGDIVGKSAAILIEEFSGEKMNDIAAAMIRLAEKRHGGKFMIFSDMSKPTISIERLNALFSPKSVYTCEEC